jgi:hypothetical protein
MNPANLKLQINDVVSAQVVEAMAPDEYLVSVDGDLIRVKNTSGQKLNANAYVLLRVIAIKPLQFQLASGGVRNFDWHV